jgi:acyl-CoA synthetase (AMP-forming)/AMP-acid ligase II
MVDFAQAAHVVDVIRRHAQQRGEQDAVTLITDPIRAEASVSMSYLQLDEQARRIAAWLQARCAQGDRVLLLYAPGLNFAAAFIGCIYAGMVAAPAPLPGQQSHQQRRIRSIANNAGVAAILTDSVNGDAVAALAEAQGLTAIPRLATDTAGFADPEAWRMPPMDRQSLVLLQYTSGSTGEPKGVMITQDNLLQNVNSLRRAYGLTGQTRFGGWIPMFHDMGLMGLLLPALFLGSTCILMTPTTFLKRPYLWLKMIDRFNIHFSAAPNFAYDLCLQRVEDGQIAGLDLSRWQFAANGSEPVQAGTITAFAARFGGIGFRADAMCPCYGMAETTLFVAGTGQRAPRLHAVDAQALERHVLLPQAGGRALVSCGRADDYDVRIADLATGLPMPAGMIGEIWLRGHSVASGYWQNPAASAAVFDASPGPGEGGYFRTGDLGAIWDGELYITGRSKEMLIVHGRNLYPQDIESVLRERHPELAGAAGAVFAIAVPQEEMIVIHEVRGLCSQETLQQLARGIKTTIMQELGVRVMGVMLLRTGGVLRTTSGKIQRSAMRHAFLGSRLTPLYEEMDSVAQAARHAMSAASQPAFSEAAA